jgi:hypothetical protein
MRATSQNFLEAGRVAAWTAAVIAIVLLAVVVPNAQETPGRRLDRTAARKETFPPAPTPSWDAGSTELYRQKNPGSAANVGQPGRVRTDAPAQFEVIRSLFLTDYTKESWRWMNEPAIPVPPTEPDTRFVGTVRLTADDRSDDFPDIASNPADPGQVWAVWQSYSGRRDQIHLMPFLAKWNLWSTYNPVPGVNGDVYRPRLAFDGSGRVWVIWAQQRQLYEANFDLFARAFDGERWGPLRRLTSEKGGDFNHAVASGVDGAIHVAWQAFRSGRSDIFYMRYAATEWCEARRISASDANDWSPALAVDRAGNVHIAWDSYERGSYDVMLRTVQADGELSPIREVAATEFFEARPSVAVDHEDRIWVAFEVGEMNWGKDQGATVVPEPAPGARLNEHRQVQVRVLEGDRVRSPQPEVASLFPAHPVIRFVADPRPMISNPLLAVDGAGRIHLVVRRFFTQGGYDQSWSFFVTTMTADGWSEPVEVPYSNGRLSMFAAAAPAADGSLWLIWPRDNNLTTSTWINLPEETLVENVYAARFAPTVEAGQDVMLGEVVAPDFPVRPENDPEEAARVAAMRARRARVAGRDLQILRGDTHRHTELSLDFRAVPDGSALDFYRYVLDAADLDFGLITDHQAGGDREYWWWYTEKLADLFYSPERYIPLFGYERSVAYPNGHRNIIHARRGIEHIPFFMDLDETPMRMHNVCTYVTADDTELVYEALRKSGGISIPHTSATNMGTDWRDNDPEVEPLVEIFQGDRYSYEAEGAPLTDPGAEEGTTQVDQIEPAGFVANAWDRGYRLGVVASSDHLSTHISYAMVWARERTRHAVLDAMKARHTYGATDNIILEFWIGEQFMGDEFSSDDVPPILVRAVGTGPVAAVDLIRNNRSIYRSGGGGPEVEVTYLDTAPEPGTSFYYVRLEQVDGNVAWSSPIWVRRPE